MTQSEQEIPRETVEVVVTRPFCRARGTHAVAAGGSVEDIVASVLPDAVLRHCAHVLFGGAFLPRDKWKNVRPKAGTALDIRIVPAGGGGGKNPLRTVLSLALAAASPMLAGPIAGMLGAGSLRFVTAGVNLLGKLALNALAPPPRPRFGPNRKESQTLFLQGARNQAVPFGRVPKVLGRHRFVPPLGALPYTETAGADQYLRMLFVWGYGPLRISDLKIGETPLEEFDGVEIETREGYDDDAELTLYANAVLQNDLQAAVRAANGYIVRTTEAEADEISVDITLPRGLFRFNGNNEKVSAAVSIEVQYAPAGTEDWSAGVAAYKAIAPQAAVLAAKPDPYRFANVTYAVTRIDRIALDPASGAIKVIKGATHREGKDTGTASAPALPAGYVALAQVERRSADSADIPPERITDERDPALFGAAFEGSGDFTVGEHGMADRVSVGAGGLRFSGFYISGKQSSALRKSLSFRVARGQYDVRLRRITADAATDNVFDETAWTALRTIRYARPIRMQGLAVTALRIKATDQLQGIIDRFNGVVHSILPDWNGEEWVEQVTSNPASLFRHALQGRGNARPLADNRLDLGRLEAWHDACAQSSREFNAVIDYDISVREILQDIAAAGRASPALIDGKWAIVEDKPQNAPVQHFTPRNTWGFQGQKAFDDLPHALRVRFINRAKGWLQDERLVYDDGHDAETAEKYETLELNGVTDAEQAWRDGRYHIATARLRPETYSFHADLEHIVCTRGDLVRFSHDVPLFGLGSARVAAVAASGGNITGVTLDADMTMEEEKSYAVRFRKADGGSLVKSVVCVPGTSKELAFAEPDAQGPATGDLALFGESGLESVELVVRAVEPGPDLSARIICVDAAPGIHAADTGTIPEFTSHITLPPEMKRPPPPVLAQIQSGGESLIRHTDGSFTARIHITLEPPVFDKPLALQALIRAADETFFRRATVFAAAQDAVSLTDIAEGEIYDIQLKYATAEGVLSPPLLIAGHRVTGSSALPADVADFSLNALGDTLHLSWSPVRDIDLSHYVLRYAPETSGVLWSNAIDIVRQIAGDATSISLPAAPGTYLLKAADVGGRISANAAAAVTTMPGLAGYNAVLTVAESPDYAGTKTGVGVSGGALQLSGADSLDDWPDIDAVENADVGLAGLGIEGVYEFGDIADLGAVYTSRLTAALAVNGIDFNTGIDAWDVLDDVEGWDQDVDPSLWSAALQIATTPDDPGSGPAWSGWMPFVIGDYHARAFKFRVLLRSAALNITPSLSTLSVDIDMPERRSGARDLASDAAGSAMLFDRPFRAVPVISVTARDLGTGDYYAITSPTASGFSIRFFNAGGAGVVRHFDYLAVGYGEAV